MANQPEFDFTKGADPTAQEVERLVTYLDKQGPVWTTAKQIQAALGFNDRKLRVLRSLAKSRIVSGPGCPGYRHIRHCTLDDIKEAAARKKSQIRAMIADYIALLKSAHSTIR